MKKTSVYIETHGCQMNVADTERAIGNLRAAGYVLSDTHESADVVLLNTCSVRERAEQKVFNRIGEIRHSRVKGKQPLVGVMGCVAQLGGDKLFARKAAGIDFIVGTRATDRLPQLTARALRGEREVIDLDERAEGERWDVGFESRLRAKTAFVPIIEGCNKFCSYCIVPYSRGREKSREAAEIISEIVKLREQGFLEVHLIGQNVNSYRPVTEKGLEGYAGATPFARLLRAVANTSMPRIKFTTNFPRDFHADIVAALDEHANLCNWVHLPVQSGSDRVLRSMRRGYKAADYMKRVEFIKQAHKRLAVTSDVIVGFAGETARDFEDTLSLVEACQYDGLYIFKYSVRSGTPSSKMLDDVSEEEKGERFKRLDSLQREIQGKIYQTFLGTTQEVLVEGRSTRNLNDLTGHTTCHKVLNFSGGEARHIGTLAMVEVTDAKPNSLYGKLL